MKHQNQMSISMINHVKHVLFEYRTFIMKMALDAPTITSTKSNLCLLTNLKMLGLNAIMSLLEAVHSLIKFSQLHDIFVCDLIQQQ
jgi:hypothetical protein